MVDIKAAKEAALAEVEKENMDKAKNRFKQKMHELKAAEKVVANIKRELEDLDDELRND